VSGGAQKAWASPTSCILAKIVCLGGLRRAVAEARDLDQNRHVASAAKEAAIKIAHPGTTTPIRFARGCDGAVAVP